MPLREARDAEVRDEAAVRARRAEVEAELGRTSAREHALERAVAEQAPALTRASDTWYGLATLEERLRGTAALAAERRRSLTAAAVDPARPGRDPEQLEQEAAAVRQSEAELAGKKYPDEIRKTIKLVIKDDKYTVTVGTEGADQGTVKLDPSANPKTMDITGTDGPNKGKTFLCIYELDGDTLRVCYDLRGKARPTEFKTKPGTKLYLVTYKRS